MHVNAKGRDGGGGSSTPSYVELVWPHVSVLYLLFFVFCLLYQTWSGKYYTRLLIILT